MPGQCESAIAAERVGNLSESSIEHRRATRSRVYYMARLASRGVEEPVKLLDVSSLGVRVETHLLLSVDDRVILSRDDFSLPCRVVRIEGQKAGLEFIDPPGPDVIAEKLAHRRSAR